MTGHSKIKTQIILGKKSSRLKQIYGTILALSIMAGGMYLFSENQRITKEKNNSYHKLILLIQQDDVKGAKAFLEKDSQNLLHYSDSNGRAAITYATSIEMINLLTANGADIHATDHNEKSVISYIVENKGCRQKNSNQYYSKKSLILHLYHRGVNVNHPDKNGITPLMIAVAQNDETAYEELMDCGVNVNLKTKEGISPLMIAIGSKDLNLFFRLLQDGADINATDNQGRGLIYYGKQSQNPNAVFISKQKNINPFDYSLQHIRED